MATSRRKETGSRSRRRLAQWWQAERGGQHCSLLFSHALHIPSLFLVSQEPTDPLVLSTTAALLGSPDGRPGALSFHLGHVQGFFLGSAPASGIFICCLRSHFYLNGGDRKWCCPLPVSVDLWWGPCSSPRWTLFVPTWIKDSGIVIVSAASELF